MGVLTAGTDLPLVSEHTAFVRRHWGRIGGLMVLGLLIGLAGSLAQPSTWSSTASVSLAPVPKYVLPTGIGLAPTEVSIDTDAQLLNSPGVLKAVADVLGTDPGSAMQHVSVTATPISHVLHVTVQASSAPTAAAAADAAVAALVRVRRDALGALRLDQLRLLRLYLSGQEDVLAQAQNRGVVVPASDELFAYVVALRAALTELEEARLSPAEVIDPAVVPTRADYSNREVPVTSGAMLGLLAGCLLGAGLDHRRPNRASPRRPQPIPSAGWMPAAHHRHQDAAHAI